MGNGYKFNNSCGKIKAALLKLKRAAIVRAHPRRVFILIFISTRRLRTN
jgi:hypothetical protein